MKIINKVKKQDGTNKTSRIKFLGITLYKKTKKEDKSKVKILGIPVLKTKLKKKGANISKKKVYLLGLPCVKILKKIQVKKIYLLAIPFIKKKIKNNTQKIYFLGLPLIKIKQKNNMRKIYFIGIRVSSKNLLLSTDINYALKAPKHIKFNNVTQPTVSIIIPVYNQYDYTMNCLYSIKLSEDKTPYEIIIADDCSTDATRKIEKCVQNITVIHNKKNLGYIGNINNAAHFAKGKYLYFLNNDTIVQKKWLEHLVNVLDTNEDIGVVGSKILNADGSLQECGVFMFSDIFYNSAHTSIQTSQNNYLRQCDYVSGCSLLTRKTLFDEIGGFDKRYAPAYCDDPDYCIAALKKGFKTYIQPKSVLVHFGSVSYFEKSSALKDRNNILLREKWAEFFETRSNHDRRKDYTGVNRKSTLLVIDDLLPQFDRHAGGKTIFQFLQLFIKMNLNVKFCPLFGNNYEEPYYSILTDMGIEVIKKEHIHSWIDDNIGYLDYILLSRPQVAELFMIKALKARGVKVLYYGHDLHHVRMKRESAYKNDADLKEIEKMEKVEKSVISFCDEALYPSITEKQYVNEIFKLNNVEVITPYLYDTNKMIKHSSFEESQDIVFVGSSHGPNLDGLLWFINKIFPAIVQRIPDIRLNIVGSSVAEEILKIQSPNINVIGFLSEEELNELYSKTKLSIAPLRYGAGIKGKIIDSLYHSTPVVTTQIGIEGINNEYGLIKYSDSEEGFAQKLIDLYLNSDEWNKLIPLYSKFIQENYSFDVAEKTFSRFIDTQGRKNEERVL